MTTPAASAGQFDYKDTQVNTVNFVATESCAVVCSKNSVEVVEANAGENSVEASLQIDQNDNDFLVSQPVPTAKQQSSVWIPVQLNTSRTHWLTEGTWLKIGKIHFRVASRAKASAPAAASLEPESGACKICLCSEGSSANPLISPCKCTGSLQYVHFGCLKEWVHSRVETRSTAKVRSVYWTRLKCELCGSPLPQTFEVQGEALHLLSVEEVPANALVLEDYRLGFSFPHATHILSGFGLRGVSIGRAQCADLRITDISVSRRHSRIKLVDGKFHVIDENSRFGTLLLMQKALRLAKDAEVALQVKSSLITFKAKRQTVSRLWCCLPFSCTQENTAPTTKREKQRMNTKVAPLPQQA